MTTCDESFKDSRKNFTSGTVDLKGKMVLWNTCPLPRLSEKGKCDEAKALPLLRSGRTCLL